MLDQLRMPSPLTTFASSPLRFLTSAVTAIALLAAVAVFASFVVPKLLGLQAQVVLSGSMEPAIKTGGIAFLQPMSDLTKIKAGDIITFKRPNGTGDLITHRVTMVQRGTDGKLEFKTKGDASKADDLWTVPAANVSGVIKFDLPYLGYLVELARSRTGFFLLIAIPAALILIGELRAVRGQSSSGGKKPT